MKGFDWSGMDVVVMASGPSLTGSDVELVRQWRLSGKDRRVIVTNTTYKVAPWADALYARDFAWWRVYREAAQQEFSGAMMTNLDGVRGVIAMHLALNPSNSGADAAFLASQFGANRIILLGCDARYGERGERHHHGDHPKGMGNCQSVSDFYGQFKRAAAFIRRPVVNASRSTILDFWPRESLRGALFGAHQRSMTA
ncbi:hypothetical protein [uncultured Halomonas sp.]|uniref:hypothetical protein n=1 Tax=uncultured Halomonas sp. TaxID=173971 RepID=UPI002596F4D3|nr:hypothetical protein [uncultured Halomonas sp.]|tara:strand:- start:1430 stop:2023 length:594 start_codon:yes stop_codon:yes gene_type:complete